MKILIIRLSAMGDAAMVAPVVAALRKDYPQAEITVLTRKLFRAFFNDIKDVQFAEFDPKGRHKGIAGLLRLNKELGHFDYVADMHDVLRTKIIRKLQLFSGAKVRHINKGRLEKQRLTRLKGKQLKQLTLTIDRYRDVLLRLGLNVSAPEVPVHNPRTLSEKAQTLCKERLQGQKWIGIAPFAQHQGKIYPVERMARVVEILSSKGHKLFIFGGGEFERKIAEQWQTQFQNTVSVIGQISLNEEMELISNLDAIICMDSSSMHMASLMGTTAISIWGATHPFAGFMGFGQKIENSVQLDLDCRPCSIYGNKPCHYGDYRCMNNITPQCIVEKVESIINE